MNKSKNVKTTKGEEVKKIKMKKTNSGITLE